jgi:hypothetical protein
MKCAARSATTDGWDPSPMACASTACSCIVSRPHEFQGVTQQPEPADVL